MLQNEKVFFQSEGLKVVGSLFRPENYKGNSSLLPGVLVAGAMTGVKEQVAGKLRRAYCQIGLCYFGDRS
jgi:hypothetical protein